ncbi:Hypothetical predicted protein [Lecanosticta acicola]|uniref:Uncharacterized protein n=1 Tax=Lecanosticta acicola TaxID=111012 RepID=A0AAI8Z7K0_9PEZI|nr:Hypothetical predicted protein [Lecanosticta acicola]
MLKNIPIRASFVGDVSSYDMSIGDRTKLHVRLRFSKKFDFYATNGTSITIGIGDAGTYSTWDYVQAWYSPKACVASKKEWVCGAITRFGEDSRLIGFTCLRALNEMDGVSKASSGRDLSSSLTGDHMPVASASSHREESVPEAEEHGDSIVYGITSPSETSSTTSDVARPRKSNGLRQLVFKPQNLAKFGKSLPAKEPKSSRGSEKKPG